jgi:hypothetical protein
MQTATARDKFRISMLRSLSQTLDICAERIQVVERGPVHLPVDFGLALPEN